MYFLDERNGIKMDAFDIFEVIVTLISLIKPIMIIGVIIAIVIKATTSSGNNKYGRTNGYNANQYNQPYNMNQNQNGYNGNQYNQSYNMNQNGYNTNQYNQQYNANQSSNGQTYYNSSSNASVGYNQTYGQNVTPVVGATNSSSAMPQMNDNQEKVTCKNCGAENIIPASRSNTYSCYFCKQVL